MKAIRVTRDVDIPPPAIWAELSDRRELECHLLVFAPRTIELREEHHTVLWEAGGERGGIRVVPHGAGSRLIAGIEELPPDEQPTPLPLSARLARAEAQGEPSVRAATRRPIVMAAPTRKEAEALLNELVDHLGRARQPETAGRTAVDRVEARV